MSESDFEGMGRVFRHMNETAKRKGWWEGYPVDNLPPELTAMKLCLIHSEVSEALESARNGEPGFYYAPDGSGKPEGLAVELADVVIRCADLCEHLKLDLADAIRIKMAYNETRPHKHGGKAI